MSWLSQQIFSSFIRMLVYTNRFNVGVKVKVDCLSKRIDRYLSPDRLSVHFGRRSGGINRELRADD